MDGGKPAERPGGGINTTTEGPTMTGQFVGGDVANEPSQKQKPPKQKEVPPQPMSPPTPPSPQVEPRHRILRRHFNYAIARLETHLSRRAFSYLIFLVLVSALAISFYWGYREQTEYDIATSHIRVFLSISRGAARSLTITLALSFLLAAKVLVSKFKQTDIGVTVSFSEAFPARHRQMSLIVVVFSLVHVVSATAAYIIFKVRFTGQAFGPMMTTATGVFLTIVILFVAWTGWTLPRLIDGSQAAQRIKIAHGVASLLGLALVGIHGVDRTVPFTYRWALPAAAIYACDRLYRLSLRRQFTAQVRVEDVVARHDEALHFSVLRPVRIRAGQFFYVKAPTVSPHWQRLWPASSPTSSRIHFLLRADNARELALAQAIAALQDDDEPLMLNFHGPFGTPCNYTKPFQRYILISADTDATGGAVPFLSVLKTLRAYSDDGEDEGNDDVQTGQDETPQDGPPRGDDDVPVDLNVHNSEDLLVQDGTESVSVERLRELHVRVYERVAQHYAIELGKVDDDESIDTLGFEPNIDVPHFLIRVSHYMRRRDELQKRESERMIEAERTSAAEAVTEPLPVLQPAGDVAIQSDMKKTNSHDAPEATAPEAIDTSRDSAAGNGSGSNAPEQNYFNLGEIGRIKDIAVKYIAEAKEVVEEVKEEIEAVHQEDVNEQYKRKPDGTLASCAEGASQEPNGASGLRHTTQGPDVTDGGDGDGQDDDGSLEEPRSKPAQVVHRILRSQFVRRIVLTGKNVAEQQEDLCGARESKRGLVNAISLVLGDIVLLFTGRSKAAQGESKIWRWMIKVRDVLLVILQSTFVNFMHLVLVVSRYDVIIVGALIGVTSVTTSVSAEASASFVKAETALGAIVAVVVTKTILLELSCLGGKFFQSKAQLVDMFFLVPVLCGSIAYGVWALRTDGDSSPRHTLFQIVLLLPLKLVLLSWRLHRTIGLRQTIKERNWDEVITPGSQRRAVAFNKETRPDVDFLWAIRPSDDGQWMQQEIEPMVHGDHMRSIPFVPRAHKRNEKEDDKRDHIRDIEANKMHLDWDATFTGVMAETPSNSKVAVFLCGEDSHARQTQELLRRIEVVSHLRAAYLLVNADSTIIEELGLKNSQELQALRAVGCQVRFAFRREAFL